MEQQKVNLQYAYNSLMQSYMDLVKENSYKDAIITSQREKIDELKGDNKDDNTD
ncbi:hypothetical protein [Virgibacillus alimentarius]|uniref:hypothetical protein n=1 Tax=Virgibacillus alimentarius TaxID=698769 RepID=UPI000AD19A60|nr:hypothetical protein [Virgibacillus alimentarius]